MSQTDLLALLRFRVHESLITNSPVLLIGSGFSAGEPYGLPSIRELGIRVVDSLSTNTRVDKGLVALFADEVGNVGYERAINIVPGMSEFAADIIDVIQGVVAERDISAYEMLVGKREATGLASFLEARCQASNPPLVVLTTNYDRIIEYECGLAGIPCHTGFANNYVSEFTEQFPGRPRSRAKCSLVVDLYKVHGSLGWYRDPNGKYWQLPLARLPPAGFKSVMIVPGEEKFEATHQGIYRKLMTASDALVRRAKSIFVVGYGFNDDHIHEPLRDGTSQATRPQPIVILARTMTPAGLNFIKTARRYLALERTVDGDTLVYCDELSIPEVLNGKNYWDINHLMDLMRP